MSPQGANDTSAGSGEYRVTGRAHASPPASPSPPVSRRYSTVEMEAPPRSAGRELHDLDFDFDIDSDGALELESMAAFDAPPAAVPSRPAPPPPSSSRITTLPGMVATRRATPNPSSRKAHEAMLPPAPPWPTAPPTSRRSSPSHSALDPHSALVAFAGFGEPPESVFGSPRYAVRVMLRRRSLRIDLQRARRRRSPDVGLYEASLRAADDGAVRTGLFLMSLGAVFAIMVVIAATQVISIAGGLHLPW